MKPSSTFTGLGYVLALLFLVLFIREKRNNRGLETRLRIESTKFDLITDSMKEMPYDSVYSRGDTISFYKNHTLIRQSVSSED